jgi:hypothetical protein
MGRFQDAVSICGDGLKLRKLNLGDDDPDTLASQFLLACCYKSLRKYSDAVVLYEDCLKRMKTTLGDDHLLTLRTLNEVAGCREAMKKCPKVDEDSHRL